MIRRALALVLMSVLLTAGLAGCSKGDRFKKELLAVLAKSQQLSGRFAYDDKSGGVDTRVNGIAADDYRYKAELSVDGVPKVDEVVYDDAVADLFLDQQSVPLLARRGADGHLLTPPTDDAVTTASGISVIDALSTQRWVVDPTGAPTIYGGVGKHPVGQDPIYDARTVLTYVTNAVNQAANVAKYDSESISPTYKTKDDPFPKPKHGARLVRYDLAPPPIPRKSTTAASGANQRVPEVQNFRRMVVYVDNGVVVRVMESTDLGWKLDELKRAYSLTLTGSTDQQAAAALAGINVVRGGQGNDLLRARDMDFNFLDVGQKFDVSLPTVSVVGPLHLLVNRGKSTTAAGTVDTTTTTPTSATSTP